MVTDNVADPLVIKCGVLCLTVRFKACRTAMVRTFNYNSHTSQTESDYD